MHCDQIQHYLDDFIDGQLLPIQQEAILMHLQTCTACHKRFVQAQQIQQSLRDFAVPLPTADFEKRMFMTVNSQQHKGVKRSFIAGFSTAIAASFALWFVSLAGLLPGSSEVDEIRIQLIPQQTQQVNLVFHSPRHLQKASLTLALPEGVEIKGYPGRTELAWPTEIKKGANRLTLPLIATGSGKGVLSARIKHRQHDKTFYLKVNTATPTSTLPLKIINPVT